MKSGYRILQLILIVCIGLPILLLAAVCFLLYHYSYQEFLQQVAVAIGKPQWKEFLQSGFSISAFQFSRIASVAILTILVFLFFFAWQKRNKLAEGSAAFVQHLKAGFHSVCSRLKKYSSIDIAFIVILLALLTARSLWLINTVPMQYDEMWTSNYYIDKTLWKSFILPGNNHILYSFVASLFLYLPVDRDIAIRLPAMIGALAFVFIYWMMTRKYFNSFSSIVSTAFVSGSVLVTMFSVLARSYSFVLLFSVLLFWIFIKLKEDPHSKFWNACCLFVVIPGYLSNPLFFFTHCFFVIVAVSDAIRTKSWLFFRNFLKAGLLALPILFILYLPDILTDHAAEIVKYGFPQVHKRSFALLIETIVLLGNWLMGFEWGSVILVPAIIISAWLTRKVAVVGFFTASSVIALGMLLLFSFIQAKPLFDHVVIFFTICTGISLAGLCFYFSRNFSLNRAAISGVAVLVFLLNSFFAYRGEFFRWSRQMDNDARDVSRVLQSQNLRKIYLQSGYLKPAIEYYGRKKGWDPEINMSAEASLDFRPFNADDGYDVIVVDPGIVLPGMNARYQKAFNFQNAEIWLLKKAN